VVEPWLSGMAEDLLIVGHTHLAMDRSIGRARVLNPGSVGLPLDGDHRAGYLLLEAFDGAWRPSFRRVPYDLTPVMAAFEQLQFVERCGLVGRLIVAEFETARPQVVPFRSWYEAHRACVALTQSLFDEFRRESLWQWTNDAYRVNAGPGFAPTP
jgi:diadenosine tetraphosphatase ApaH/serine/threonine PP2A family protein phosphatase